MKDDGVLFQDYHPLSGAKGWTFVQPSIGLETKARFRSLATGEVTDLSRQIFDTCRERTITYYRDWLKNTIIDGAKKRKSEIILNAPEILIPGATVLSVFHVALVNSGRSEGRPANFPNPINFPTREDWLKYEANFVPIMDALVGLPALLLNPERLPGDWWRTPPEKLWFDRNPAAGSPSWHTRWQGADNSMLYHPALLAIIMGLFRQAHILFTAKQWDAILEAAPRAKVEKALTECDRKLAEELVHKLRLWINVPPAPGGDYSNFPFPWYVRKKKQVSYWQRFVHLYRAIEAHGMGKVLGGDIAENWGLEDKSPYYAGVYSFWGSGQAQDTEERKGELTEAHRRVMELGARARDEEE